MFNAKSKSENSENLPASASMIGAGTTLKGDITSNGDLRIDGSLIGNIIGSAKVIIGANGSVDGDISCQHADIMGAVTGSISTKELLQLKNGSIVKGNISAAKLQVEPAATFNGQCHMQETGASGSVVAMNEMEESDYGKTASR